MDIRMPQIFLLGLMQGFPWVLIGSTMSLWLKEEGLSRSSIGLFGLVFSVYSINFLWAPLLDRIRIPLLSRWLGQRRSWVFVMQVIIFSCMVGMFFLSPSKNIWWIALLGLIISTSSATQDISLDALRIDMIGEDEQAKQTAAAAVMVAGWWTAFKLGGAIGLYLADFYQSLGLPNSWQLVYISLTLFVVIANLFQLTIKETTDKVRSRNQQEYDTRILERVREWNIPSETANRLLAWLGGTMVAPIWSFFRRNGVVVALTLLGFIMLFKIGEAFLGRMSIIFYSEIGFSKAEIAHYSKLIGWVATVVFSIAGGIINARFGLLKGVFISGIAMASTNLLFSLMAMVGPKPELFIFAIVADEFTSAVSAVTFVAFISQLCDRTFSASQYALMASLASVGRNTLASFSGIMVDKLGGNWSLFFICTTVMVIPSLILLAFIGHKLQDIFDNAKNFTNGNGNGKKGEAEAS